MTHDPDEQYPKFPNFMSVVKTGKDVTITRVPGGVVYASGPCPQCGAPEQSGNALGKMQPIASDRSELGGAGKVSFDTSSIQLSTAIRVECNCGSEHKRTGKTGCGAIWYWTTNK